MTWWTKKLSGGILFHQIKSKNITIQSTAREERLFIKADDYLTVDEARELGSRLMRFATSNNIKLNTPEGEILREIERLLWNYSDTMVVNIMSALLAGSTIRDALKKGNEGKSLEANEHGG